MKSRTPCRARICLVAVLLLGILCGGCKKQSTEPEGKQPQTSGPSQLLVIDDAALAAAIREHWTTRGAGEVQVDEATAEEALAGGDRWASVDAVIYPAGLLGALAEKKRIAALPERTLDDENLGWEEVFHLVRMRETSWDRTPYAVSLGSPVLVLFYRADLWQKHQLPVPTTWEAYAAGLATLRSNADGTVELMQSAEPLGAVWGGQTLLARAAAYAHHRNYLSVLFDSEAMQPLIDGPPFVRALEELVAAAGREECLQFGPQDTIQALLDGKAMSAIGWPAARMAIPEAKMASGMQIAVCELPGATQSYDRNRQVWDERPTDDQHVTLLSIAGRLASVTQRASSERMASSLLVLTAGKEWAPQIAPASSATTLFRQDQVDAPQFWVSDKAFPNAIAGQYATTVAQSLERGSSVVSLRIPGRGEYLRELDVAVARAVRGEATAAEALQQAAQRWREITETLGLDAQRAAYRRSLGL